MIAAGQLAAGLVLDAAPTPVRFPQGASVLDRVRALGASPYVLLLGTSRFREIDMHTVDEALREAVGPEGPRVVKGAVEAGDPVVASYLLEEILARGSHPEVVVLEISPETIARPAPWVAEHAIRFFTWADVAAWAPEILTGDRPARVAAARLAPIQVYRRELLTWLVGSAPPYLRVPHSGSDTYPTAVEPRSAARTNAAAGGSAHRQPNAGTLRGLRQTRKWLRHYHPDGGAARALEHVVARCHETGTRVVLVGVPVSSWVRALYSPEIERAFLDQIERIGRRYGAEFLDCRARIPDPFFKDHHHLNVRGGTVFARMLVDEVLARQRQ